MTKDNFHVYFATRCRYDFSWEIKKFSSFCGILKSDVMNLEPVCSSTWKLVVCCEGDETMQLGLQRCDRNTHVVKVKVHFVFRNSRETPMLAETLEDVFTWADETKFHPEHLPRPTPDQKNQIRLCKDDTLTIDGHIIPYCCLQRQISGMEDLTEAQEDLKSLLSDDQYTDVELSAKDESILAHKFILASRSSFFKNLFEIDKSTVDSNCVNFEIDKVVLLALLKFIYSGILEDLDVPQILECYGMAYEFELKDLQDICHDRLCSFISESNVCKILLSAHKFEDKVLTEKASSFLCKNFHSVPEDEWTNFVKSKSDIVPNIMIQIHSSDCLE